MKNRKESLKELPRTTLRKAWFTLAHLLLEPGATVVDMGCEDGMMAYAMALFNPQIQVIAVDKSRRLINKARKLYEAPNLEYRIGDITKEIFEPNSLDAVVNSYILHDVYSGSKYSERAVRQTLRRHFDMLKTNGMMFIQDYARPPPEEYILMEMPDLPSRGQDITEMSEADLLVWFSENARPSSHDPTSGGFFLEELPARFPKTRLFRLPYKWAYEFVMRKDNRANWDNELPTEYTFFTKREFRKELRALGARVTYSTPHWDDNIVSKRFEGHFRLYDEDGTPLGAPATSFICLAQKHGEGKSLALQERRPSKEKSSDIRIIAMRNEFDGRIVDIVTRDYNITEVLPYRITDDGRLNVFIHEGIPRGIVNAVPRHGENLDGKRYSGHMIESISVETDTVKNAERGGYKETIKFAMNYLGLKPAIGTNFEDGPAFYPAPDYIDERIETRYLRIENSDSKPAEPKFITEDADGFSTRGRIRELDAQNILNAISAGLVPNARLETQLLALYQHVGIKPEVWAESPLQLPEEEIEEVTSVKDLLSKMAEDDNRYKEVKGTAGDTRIIHSIFVDEGYDEGGVTGLASRDLDFVIPDDDTVNKAVCLPLTKNISGEVMAGVVTDYLPIPQRYKGNGLTVSCPSFTLPKHIKDMEAAKEYVAEQFETEPEKVSKLGESFYCHSGLTPQRIFPFAVASYGIDNWMKKGRGHGVTSITPLYDLWKMLYWDNHDSFIKVVGLAYVSYCNNTELVSSNWGFNYSLAAQRAQPISSNASEIVGHSGSMHIDVERALREGAKTEYEAELLKELDKNKKREEKNYENE